MDSKIIYVFDWDCTITTRHYYYFMNHYKSFNKLYYNDIEYKNVNDKYLAKTPSINEKGNIVRGELDNLAKAELNTDKKIITYMDILDQPILTYIVELFFGIHRFFALRDMFQVLHNKNINIIIMSIGVGHDIIKLLKILLYSHDNILQNIHIYANNIAGNTGEIYFYVDGRETRLGAYKKSYIINNLLNSSNSNAKVFYVDDDNQYNNELTRHGHNRNPNKYVFYDTLEKNGVGLTLIDIQYICNFNFPAHDSQLSGGNKSNYIKLKKYLQ